MSETTLIIEIWNGQNSWHMFINRSPIQNGIWLNYLFSWNKISLDVFLNGVLLQQQNSPSSVRMGLLTSSASKHATRLAIGRFSSTDDDSIFSPTDDGSISKVKMHFDDFQIWERPFNETEALQVYNIGE